MCAIKVPFASAPLASSSCSLLENESLPSRQLANSLVYLPIYYGSFDSSEIESWPGTWPLIALHLPLLMQLTRCSGRTARNSLGPSLRTKKSAICIFQVDVTWRIIELIPFAWKFLAFQFVIQFAMQSCPFCLHQK